MQNTIILFSLAIAITGSHAQSVTEVMVSHQRDEIPSQVSSGSVRFVQLLPSWSSVEVTGTFQAMTMDEAYGLSARTLGVYGIQASYSLPLFGERVIFSAGPRMEFVSAKENELSPGYSLNLRTSFQPDGDELSVKAMLTFERKLYQAGVLSLDTRIVRDGAGVQLSGEWVRKLSVTVNAERLFLSDRNVIDNLYTYALVRVLSQPELHIGYAFQYSNAREDRWTATASTHVDQGTTFAYTYFYVPYFTPLNESGHSVLASVRWSPLSWMAVLFRTSIPVFSRTERSWYPPYGIDMSPPSTEARFIEKNSVQSTISGSLEFQISSRQWLAFGIERFNKPYYTYSQAQAKLTMTF